MFFFLDVTLQFQSSGRFLVSVLVIVPVVVVLAVVVAAAAAAAKEVVFSVYE